MSLYLRLFVLGMPTIEFLHYAKMEGDILVHFITCSVSFRKGRGEGGVECSQPISPALLQVRTPCTRIFLCLLF